MQKVLPILSFLFFTLAGLAQNVGIGTTTPAGSALLDISSTTKGFIMPRMTTSQRNDIASPAIGLQIFNLDDQCTDIYDGANWIKTCGLKVTGPATDPYHPTANSWTQKANFGGTARSGAVGFSIGSKGYIGTGDDGSFKSDFWEYDPASNAWTQKANFGGTARYGAVGFSIGSKGYIGTGSDGSFKSDFWEYNPASNAWTQKANFGGTARYGAVGFSITSKGYIGTGSDGSFKSDFWEYDPASNAWTQKTNFTGLSRVNAVGFSIGNKGYIGTGYDNSGNHTNDFREYDPAINAWTQKTNFGGSARYDAVGFSIGSKGYIGTGYDFPFLNYTSDFYEYDPASNTWTFKANVGGEGRSSAVGFSIGNKGYIGTGTHPPLPPPVLKNDFWEYMDNNVTGSAYSSNAISTNLSNSVSDGAWTLVNGSVYNSNTGNVGIGTTTPQNKLNVVNSIDNTALNVDLAGGDALLQLKSAGSGFWTRIGTNGSPLAIVTQGGDKTTSTPAIFVNNNGNVGIGTSLPSEKLSVIGNICYTGSIGACSDFRYKKNITPLKNSLHQVLLMQGVNYDWKVSEFPDKQFTDAKQIGFIAQDLVKLYPELVITDVNGYKSVDYSKVTPILVEAIKELSGRNEKLELEIANTNTKLANLEAKLNLILQSTSTVTAGK